MQIGHQLVDLAMCRDQRVVHVVGVAGGIADPLQPVDLGQLLDQTGERVIRALCAHAVIGVDVLTQQSDFAHAAFYQFARFGQHAGCRARDFGTAGIGHHAEGAELVAPFLHGQKCRGCTFRLAAAFQLFEFVFFGEIRI